MNVEPPELQCYAYQTPLYSTWSFQVSYATEHSFGFIFCKPADAIQMLPACLSGRWESFLVKHQ